MRVALKKALLAAYQGRGESPESPEVLLAAVAEAGLDEARARAILAGDEYAAEVRARRLMLSWPARATWWPMACPARSSTANCWPVFTESMAKWPESAVVRPSWCMAWCRHEGERHGAC